MTGIPMPPPPPPKPKEQAQAFEHKPNNRTQAVAQRARAKLSKASTIDSPYGKTAGKLMTLNELVELTGFTKNKITRYEQLGMPVLTLPGGRGQNKRYNSSMVLDFIHRYEMSKYKANIDTVMPEVDHAKEMQEAQRRKAVAEAVLSEIKVATEQGKVANVDDLMANFSDAIVNVRGALMSFRARLPGMLAHSTEEEVASILDSEVKLVLEDLVNYNHEYKES